MSSDHCVLRRPASRGTPGEAMKRVLLVRHAECEMNLHLAERYCAAPASAPRWARQRPRPRRQAPTRPRAVPR